MKAFLFLALSFAVPAAATAAECRVESGPQRVPLIELYTSEGCDSCPPADRWFARLPVGPGAAIPLSFHVDYWDSLGWKDRFARPEWSERQRARVRAGGGRTVYTPQVLLDGRDLKWHSGTALAESLARARSKPPGATLRLRLARRGDALEAEVEAGLAPGVTAPADLHVAITQGALATDVRAGENRGERLAHEHVVRTVEKVGAVGVKARTLAYGRSLAPGWRAEDLAVIAWVQDRESAEVLQAVRLAMCPAG